MICRTPMRILITGSNGFIGKNLKLRLQQDGAHEILTFDRKDKPEGLGALLQDVDWIIHLAGVNRPENIEQFKTENVNLTKQLCAAVVLTGKKIPIIFTSSAQALNNSPYGESKVAAEQVLLGFAKNTKNPIYIFRLPNVFGKWSRPNYNSVVATFCYNMSRDLPISIHDPDKNLTLVYIDDVIDCFLSVINSHATNEQFFTVEPEYKIQLSELVEKIKHFRNSRQNLLMDDVGVGLTRALYSTYISYLPTSAFSYLLDTHSDSRGNFTEFIRTQTSGQISFFTAHPGVSRGGHFHDSKTEKFLVISGQAKFRFFNMASDEYFEIISSDARPEVIETAPGWAHDVTNIGTEILICMLWANERFDSDRPDTYTFNFHDGIS
tara:strand:- start:875 stop:2014 length:1140 start_codon:yes stop_codon:yes gene_type:complete